MRIQTRNQLTARLLAWLSSGLAFGGLALGVLAPGRSALAQTSNQSSAQSPYYGSVSAGPATTEVRQLSIDDAIQLGIQHNLALVEAKAQQKAVEAQTLRNLQPMLPTITAEGQQAARQINLEALGFTPFLLGKYASLFPQVNFSEISFIVRVNTTDARLYYSQTLFDLSTIDQYRAARANAIGAYYNTQSSRGLTVLNVGTAYLQALAAQARVDVAHSLLKADQLVLDQTVAQHKAGTAANLDELRARVQFQSQQQNVIATENDFEKAKIALNREIGLAPEQKIQLTEAAPYSELSEMSIDEARQMAYRSRQDYQGLQARIRAADLQLGAARWERLPSLRFDGNYGVLGVTNGLYHGTFLAEGTLSVPIFQEAKLRGDRQVAQSNLNDLLDQFADLKRQIDQQLRDSLLDVQSSAELVRVARSNVDLARVELQQTTERFAAGVDDNLPVVQAEASLANAESSLVNSTVQFNEAKLGLARNLGIVDTQYKTFLKGK